MLARKELRYAVAKSALTSLGYTSRRIESTDGPVHVLSAQGSGALPTVVLIHGLGSQSIDYLPLLARLRRRVRRVIAPDMLGHGLSGEPRGKREISEIWRGLAHALERTLDEPAIVFGNSLGGLAALRLGIDWPHLVRALYLASPAGAPSSRDEIRALRDLFDLRSHRDALRFIDHILHEQPRIRHVMALGLRRRFVAPTPSAILANADGSAAVSASELARLRVPVRLFWGRSERLLPRSHLTFFRAHLPPHAEFEEPHGFGHSPFLDDVDAIARGIIGFAERVVRGTTPKPR